MVAAIMRILFPILLLWGFSALAGDTMFKNGSFELPVVQRRLTREQGGDPANDGRNHAWVGLDFRTSGTTGKVSGGLTNEVSRSGRQSLFIDFDHVDRPYQSAILVSNFIPVVSGTGYEIGIWGRTDAKDLINADGRSAFLKLEVEYFARDANESVGDAFYSVEPIPGTKGRDPIFKPDSWQRFYVRLITPPDAVFAQVTWRWETGSDPGEINGIMYFDDATMTGPAVANPDMTPTPSKDDTSVPPSQ